MRFTRRRNLLRSLAWLWMLKSRQPSQLGSSWKVELMFPTENQSEFRQNNRIMCWRQTRLISRHNDVTSLHICLALSLSHEPGHQNTHAVTLTSADSPDDDSVFPSMVVLTIEPKQEPFLGDKQTEAEFISCLTWRLSEGITQVTMSHILFS